MPTNLPPECVELEKKYIVAETVSEKIVALEKYLAAIPKHKGTERLCARIKTKLSKLRLEQGRRKARRGPSYVGSKYAIKKAGAAQIVLLGFTGSGKSSLLRALTNAKPEIYGYPFTTTDPVPGMMIYEDIQIQLVEAPALFEGASIGAGWGPRVLSLARNADGLVLLVDLSISNPHHQLKTIINELQQSRITIKETKARVEIKRKDSGGIQIVSFGKLESPIHDVKQLLQKMKIQHAVIKIWGNVHLDEITQALLHKTIYKPTIVLANKIDVKDAVSKLKDLNNVFPNLIILPISTMSRKAVEEVPRAIFEALKIMRIYTKKPRQPPNEKPMIVMTDSTVGDAAKLIHKDFYKGFKYARLWGSSKFPGERVGLTRVLKDKDVLEIRV